MRTRLKLKPGQRGTKKLHAIYGDRLLCVRYRYDEDLGRRYKTIELIVDEAIWSPRGRLAPPAEQGPPAGCDQPAAELPVASAAAPSPAAPPADAPPPAPPMSHTTIPPQTPVAIHIGPDEVELRIAVKFAGGSHDAGRDVWWLRYARVLAMGLYDRIVWSAHS